MQYSISVFQSNAESKVDIVEKTLNTGEEEVLEQSAEYKITKLFTEYAK